MVYSLNNQNETILDKNLCYLEASTCQIMLGDSSIEFHISEYPVLLEEMLNITLTYDIQYVARRGWLEGTNMFMGKTPLVFKENHIQEVNKQVTQETELFIGACSEPNMRWKLSIELEDLQSGQLQTVYVFFQTQSTQ